MPTPVVTTTVNYVYDPLYRLTEANYSDGRYFRYTYDAVGNRLTETKCPVLPCGAPVTNAYVYDIANRLTSVNGQAYTWDNNGNLLNDGTNTYSYDSANRLTSVTGSGNTSTYGYNGLGDRVSQTVNSVMTNYVLDLNAGLTQVLADGTNTYLYGNGRIGELQPAGFVYHLGDALGSVRQLGDEGGAVRMARSFEAYGNTLSSAGTGSSVWQFTGEARDAATNLTYLRARYLSSATGRLLTADTWPGNYKSPSTFNKYLYANANPINLVDPSGQCYEPVEWLRKYESVQCANLDQALSIYFNPRATLAQRIPATTYIAVWGAAHIALVAGLAGTSPIWGPIAVAAGLTGCSSASAPDYGQTPPAVRVITHTPTPRYPPYVEIYTATSAPTNTATATATSTVTPTATLSPYYFDFSSYPTPFPVFGTQNTAMLFGSYPRFQPDPALPGYHLGVDVVPASLATPTPVTSTPTVQVINSTPVTDPYVGAPIYAIYDGWAIVDSAHPYQIYVIYSGRPFTVTYVHVRPDSRITSAGVQIRAGENIGTLVSAIEDPDIVGGGPEGGAHLHIQVYRQSYTDIVDPTFIIR